MQRTAVDVGGGERNACFTGAGGLEIVFLHSILGYTAMICHDMLYYTILYYVMAGVCNRGGAPSKENAGPVWNSICFPSTV